MHYYRYDIQRWSFGWHEIKIYSGISAWLHWPPCPPWRRYQDKIRYTYVRFCTRITVDDLTYDNLQHCWKRLSDNYEKIDGTKRIFWLAPSSASINVIKNIQGSFKIIFLINFFLISLHILELLSLCLWFLLSIQLSTKFTVNTKRRCHVLQTWEDIPF